MIRILTFLSVIMLIACNDSPEPIQPPFNVGVHVYPNPTDHRIFIGIRNSTNSWHISVVNPAGNEIFHETVSPSSGDRSLEVNIFAEDQGYFFVFADNGDETFVTKVLKL